jgi:hypothetical protein
MLIESLDYWLVTVEGHPVSQVVLDWEVRLRVYDAAVDLDIGLTTPFRLIVGGVKHVVRPGDTETLAPLLGLLRKPVASVLAQKDGHFEVRFSDGDLLQAKPDLVYESWELSMGSGERLVCLPGGELSVSA